MKKMKVFISRLAVVFFIIQTLNLSISSVDFYNSTKSSNEVLSEKDYVDSMAEFMMENLIGFSKSTFHLKVNTDNTPKQHNLAHIDFKFLPDFSSDFNMNEHLNPLNSVLIPHKENIHNFYFIEVPIKPPQI